MELQQEQAKIVVVDDDKSDRLHARRALEQQNYHVYEAISGQRLKEIMADYAIDLILLDLKMPGENGLNIITSIRKNSDVPIIIVSGLQTLSNKQTGLYNGADDYITKPFHPEELQARITANLRRYRKSAHETRALYPFSIGAWVLNPDIADICDAQGNPRGLTIQEYQLVEKLLQASGRTLSRYDLSLHSSGRGTDIHVTRIRKKLGDPDFIQTVRGLGYRIPVPNRSL